MIGQLLDGRYEIIDRLGAGGFSETYLAQDKKRPGKPRCVVKRLHPQQTDPKFLPKIQAFFEQEAEMLEKLGEHPQIPRLLAHLMEQDELLIVQECVDGQDLSKEIMPGKRLSEGYVIKLLREVLEVLAFVHQQQVIHRDIKPANLMRRKRDGKIVLIDFGAVKQLGALSVNPQGEVKTTVVAGTPGYMPAEQANGKPRLSSDVYAVGMVAIEALTGIPPHVLPTDLQTGEVIWRNWAQVSDALAAVLTQMVRDHFRDRYIDAAAALQNLNAISPAAPLPSPIVVSPPPPQPLAKTIGLPVSLHLGNNITLELVPIPGGSFSMGSNEYESEKPIHPVSVPAFQMGNYPVTQEQYQAVMGKNPSRFQGAKCPVERVSWNDAVEFCRKLSRKSGCTVRVPSEAEWEYACRAGSNSKWCFGDHESKLGNYAWYSANANSETHPVGEKQPNAWGLYDMHGNVWEWCGDDWHESYNNAPRDGSAWIINNDNDSHSRLIRGGSWISGPRGCRSAYRFHYSSVGTDDSLGFRVVCVLPRTA